MPGPLDGINIVDLSAVISGPLTAMVLADQGADVVKVEPTSGETLRLPLFERGGLSATFVHCNRNKRGIAVDITEPEGIKIIHQLVADADVVIQNWRPGAAERHELGEADLRKINPDLIYCSISGYGPTGPYADRRIYDPIIQGLTGAPAIQLHSEFPLPDLVRQVVVDKSTSLMAAQAITAALFARERGAGGQHVELPMIDASLAFFWPDGMVRQTFVGDGEVKEGVPGYEALRLWHTKDGEIVYFAASQVEYEGLYRALGHPEWIDDPRFNSDKARWNLENRELLGGLIEDKIRSMTSAELLQKMVDNDVPAGPVLSLDEVIEDPQIKHNESVLEFEHPTAGKYRQARPAARFSVTPQDPARYPPPLLGEHTEEVLSELGYADAERKALRDKGVIA